MKRRVNIAVASVLLFGLLYLIAHHKSDLAAVYESHEPYGNAGHEAASSGLPQESLTYHNDVAKSQQESNIPLGEPYSQDASSLKDIPLFSNEPALGDPPAAPPTNSPPVLSSPDVSTDPLLSPPIDLPKAINEPSLSPADDLQFPPAPSPSLSVLEDGWAFQDDLDLDLPISALQRFSTHRPHNYHPNGPKTYAYATFLSSHNPSLKDPFYLATHNLVHRILHSPRSKTTANYPFIVFVAHYIPQEHRALLAGAGAIIRELAPLDWDPHVPGVQKRWKDLFAKLNMWAETEFSRYVFLDADAFPITHIDDMFDLAPLQDCDASKLTLDDWVDGAPVCEPYLFAATAMTVAGAAQPEFNCGSVVFTPSARMHARFLQNYAKFDKYEVRMSEQGFLNWQFGLKGAFPAVELDRKWGSIYTKVSEEGTMNVLHEKIWWDGSATREENWLDREWKQGWEEMVNFYGSDEFALEREKDGVDTL